MKTLGILTIGQSPRPDILDDLLPLLQPQHASHESVAARQSGSEAAQLNIIEMGALDGLHTEEIHALRPDEDDRLLVTKLADGSVVHVAEEALTACMQTKIDLLESMGADCIFILCTARFQGLKSNVPCIEPGSLLNQIVPQLSPNSRIGVLSPEPEQTEATKRDWAGVVDHIEVLTASPYGTAEALQKAAEHFSQMNIDLIVLDCMGYSEEIRKTMAEISGKPVILSKSLAARVVSELLEG